MNPKQKTSNKPLIDICKETYPLIRPYVAIVLIGSLLLFSIIDNTSSKIGILAALASNIIFLIFDLSNTLKTRLDKIEQSLNQPEPQSYEDFNAALKDIKQILTDKLINNKDVQIKILAVSAQFSWKVLIESAIPKLLEIGNKDPKIDIEIVIVKPSVLRHWGQKKLEDDAQNTLNGEISFRKKFKTAFANGKLKLTIRQYDNIPHWHGILIDNDILFMGRCKWDKIDNHYHLLVGQIDYRLFKKGDRYGGDARIELVENWFDLYSVRALKI